MIPSILTYFGSAKESQPQLCCLMTVLVTDLVPAETQNFLASADNYISANRFSLQKVLEASSVGCFLDKQYRPARIPPEARVKLKQYCDVH